jgi:hypothetical protein
MERYQWLASRARAAQRRPADAARLGRHSENYIDRCTRSVVPLQPNSGGHYDLLALVEELKHDISP